MANPIAIERAGVLFTVRAFPAGAPNPAKFRWAIYRDGRIGPYRRRVLRSIATDREGGAE